MTILKVDKGDNRELQNVANILAAANKIVVVTGAGISTNCGIPVSRYSSTSLLMSETETVSLGLPVHRGPLRIDTIELWPSCCHQSRHQVQHTTLRESAFN